VIELVEAIHSFDESKLGNVDVSIKIAGDRSIVAKPPIHSPNASGASNNLNFGIPGGLRATRKERQVPRCRWGKLTHQRGPMASLSHIGVSWEFGIVLRFRPVRIIR